MGLDDQALTNHFFLDFLSEKCHCLPEAILSYDLTVYPCETGCSLAGTMNLSRRRGWTT